MKVRTYLVVFGALLVLTTLTVVVSRLELPATLAVVAGLLIAAAKASLVAMFFMHLVHERQIVYLALTFTAVFCAALIALTLWTEADHIPGSEFTQPFERELP